MVKNLSIFEYLVASNLFLIPHPSILHKGVYEIHKEETINDCVGFIGFRHNYSICESYIADKLFIYNKVIIITCLYYKKYVFLNHTWASIWLPEGEEILKISKGGNIFLKIFWRGIYFLPSKGGISLTTLHQNSRIFAKILSARSTSAF